MREKQQDQYLEKNSNLKGKAFQKSWFAIMEVCCLTEDLRVHPTKLVRKTVILSFAFILRLQLQVWRKARRSSKSEVNAGIYRAEIRGGSEEEMSELVKEK